MNLKKVANVKNIVCFAAALALGIGIIAADKKGDGSPEFDKKPESSSSSSKAQGSSSKGDNKEVETVILSAEIPELSCSSVDFGGNVVFADPKGSYSFMENGSSSNGITVKDDGGADIFISIEDGKLTLKREDQPATGFVYNKHMIELKDGKLYYDSSPVEYTPTSFSAYKLTDDCIVECTGKGQYRLKNSKGEIIDECRITEQTGEELIVTADDTGFYSEGADDELFYNVYKHGDDILITSWSYILYVNGEELVPYGYSDKYVNPDIELDVDKLALDPMRPPEGYGPVGTENSGVSELTLEMLGYVNEVRKQYDMPEVYGLEKLDKAASVRAEELAQKFDHKRPDEKESSYNSVLKKQDISWWRCGENIAKGGENSREVFDTWISSQEHRALILDPDMKYMSLAKFEDGGTTYWDMLMFNDTYVPTAAE